MCPRGCGFRRRLRTAEHRRLRRERFSEKSARRRPPPRRPTSEATRPPYFSASSEASSKAKSCGPSKLKAAVETFDQAVIAEDTIDYDEPEPLPFSARHWWARRSSKPPTSDAERTYRENLKKHPHNGWALFGLKQALTAQRKSTDDVDKDLAASWARADVVLRLRDSDDASGLRHLEKVEPVGRGDQFPPQLAKVVQHFRHWNRDGGFVDLSVDLPTALTRFNLAVVSHDHVRPLNELFLVSHQ